MYNSRQLRQRPSKCVTAALYQRLPISRCGGLRYHGSHTCKINTTDICWPSRMLLKYLLTLPSVFPCCLCLQRSFSHLKSKLSSDPPFPLIILPQSNASWTISRTCVSLFSWQRPVSTNFMHADIYPFRKLSACLHELRCQYYACSLFVAASWDVSNGMF